MLTEFSTQASLSLSIFSVANMLFMLPGVRCKHCFDTTLEALYTTSDSPGAASTPRSRAALPPVSRCVTDTLHLGAAVLQLHAGSFQCETSCIILRHRVHSLDEGLHVILFVDDVLKLDDHGLGNGFWILILVAGTIHVWYDSEEHPTGYVPIRLADAMFQLDYEMILCNQFHHNPHLGSVIAQLMSLDGVA